MGGSASGDIAACIHVAVSEQKSNKARLLYYYPPDPATYHQAGDWCGWHFDIGTITGAHPSSLCCKLLPLLIAPV